MKKYYELSLVKGNRLTVGMVKSLDDIFILAEECRMISFNDHTMITWDGNGRGKCIFELNQGDGLIEIITTHFGIIEAIETEIDADWDVMQFYRDEHEYEAV